MTKIAVDCDGVLADFVTAFCQEANRIWPNRIPKDHIQTEWDGFGDLTADEQGEVWERIKGTWNWWGSLNAYPENVAALNYFLKSTRGHDVYIVTSRTQGIGDTIALQTLRWLNACGVTQEGSQNYLGVIGVPNSEDKQDIYTSSWFDFSIDDKAETVQECDDLLIQHQAFLLDRPWNQGAITKQPRVQSVQEFLDIVLASKL